MLCVTIRVATVDSDYGAACPQPQITDITSQGSHPDERQTLIFTSSLCTARYLLLRSILVDVSDSRADLMCLGTALRSNVFSVVVD